MHSLVFNMNPIYNNIIVNDIVHINIIPLYCSNYIASRQLLINAHNFL